MVERLPDRRKLIAVVYADMVGYSRLIGLDDVGTVERLRSIRASVIDPAIDEHGGRIVQTGGDSLLIVFDSIDGAVRFAVKVQQRGPFYDCDQELDRAIRFRIGINIGDAIADGTDLHGDVVNVAARLEALCPPGGICVTRAVRDHVHGQLDLVFDGLGTLNLKNISRPVEAFLARLDDYTAELTAGKEVAALLRPERPSIAILPFQNMSGDSEQEYFADGIVEEIITALSRISAFLVIARNSSFAYKGKSPDVRQVGLELGAGYVLEGSVRKAGERVRIVGQLIDATTGANLWADRFEGDVTDIFALQDRVTVGVAAAIEPKIRMAEIERALRKPTESLQAYDLVLRGRWVYQGSRRDRYEEAARLYRRAIALDPNYAVAYALLARALWLPIAFMWTEPSEGELIECVDFARTAIRLGQAEPETLGLASHIIALPGGELVEGIAVIDMALAQNPNSVDVLAASGMLRAFLGDTVTAFRHLKEAERLSPAGVRVVNKSFGLCLASFADGDYAMAADWAAQDLRERSINIAALRYRTAALALLGRLDEAGQTVNRLLAANPKITISRCRRHNEITMKNPFKRVGVVEAYYEGLRRAGLPE
jgi:TolB-like protein/class 3 adenylate cyclase/tetratricopeptide (TPR) repeat protein